MTPNDVAAHLKNARAQYKLRVTLADEKTVTVAMPKGRNRFFAAARTLDELAWVEIHILDAHGSICAPPIKRDTSGPAGDLEAIPTVTPESALVAQVTQIVTSGLSSVIREAHRAATAQAVELVTKMRTASAAELKDVLAAHKDIAQLALDRSTYFEDRLAEMEDQRRAEIDAALARHGKQRDGESAGDFRERMLYEMLFGRKLRGKAKAPNGAATEGGEAPEGADQGDDAT